MKWKCIDWKCVRTPTKSRLGIAHHKHKSSRWAEIHISWMYTTSVCEEGKRASFRAFDIANRLFSKPPIISRKTTLLFCAKIFSLLWQVSTVRQANTHAICSWKLAIREAKTYQNRRTNKNVKCNENDKPFLRERVVHWLFRCEVATAETLAPGDSTVRVMLLLYVI